MGWENAVEAYDQDECATAVESPTWDQARVQADKEASKALVIVTGGRHREIIRLDARLDKIDARIESMDQVGTRGVAVLTTRVDELMKDFAELKTELRMISANLEADMKLVKASRWQIATAVFFALVPVYAGVVFTIVTH